MKDVGPLHVLEKPRASEDFESFAKPPGVEVAAWTHWLQSLQVEAICAYAWRARPGWNLERRSVDDSMWFFFSSGRGQGACQAFPEGFRFGPGTVLLLPRGSWHWLALDPGSKLNFCTVHFQATVLGGFEALDWLGFPSLIKDDSSLGFASTSETLAREHAFAETRVGSALSGEIRVLLHRLAREQARTFRPRFAAVDSGGTRFLRAVLKLMEDNRSDPDLNVAFLAKQAGVSPSYLHRLFKKLLGASPGNHLRRLRLQHASEQLLGTGLSISEIAFANGFHDPAYFHRVFRTVYACTPGQYRRRATIIQEDGP